MPISLGENNAIESAKTAKQTAKDYLLKQLLNPAPVATIYTTVKAYVDANSRLLAMMTTLQTLANLAFGWNAASLNNPANNNDRGRYLILALILCAILH